MSDTVECEFYRATVPETTCIARIKKLKRTHHNSPAWGYNGTALGWNYEACASCGVGLKLYEKSKREEAMAKEKTCEKCGETYPADARCFDQANRALDGLTKECRWCRAEKHGGAEAPAGEVKTEPATYECKICHESKELIEENFHRNPSAKTGFHSTCKVCRNTHRRTTSSVDKGLLILDFSKHGDLLDRLQEHADAEMRTVSAQALWELSKVLFDGWS